MASVNPLSGLFPTPSLSTPIAPASSSLFEQAMRQASREKTPSASCVQAARVQWLGAQWDKQQTLFGLLSSPDSSPASGAWKWAFNELTAPGAAYGPPTWAAEVERVMGGLDPQIQAITQHMNLLTRTLAGRSTLPF